MMRPQVLDTPAAFSTGPAMTPVALRKNPLENEGLLDDKDKNTADIDADLESRVDDVALDSTKSSSKSDADLIGDGKNDPSKEDKRVKYSGSRFVSRAFAIVGVLLFAGAVAFGVFFFKDDILQLLNKQSVGSASLSNETNATAAASLNSSDALSLASHPNGTFTTDQPTQASPSVTPDVITKVTLPVTTSSPSTTTSTPTTTASSATTTTNLKLPTPAPTVPKGDDTIKAINSTGNATSTAVLHETSTFVKASAQPNTTTNVTTSHTSEPTPAVAPTPTNVTPAPTTDTPELTTTTIQPTTVTPAPTTDTPEPTTTTVQPTTVTPAPTTGTPAPTTDTVEPPSVVPAIPK